MNYIFALIAVLIISLISFVGAIGLGISSKKLERVLLILVAFSTGALIGDSFIHLLPEAVNESGGLTSKITIFFFVGILIFFVLEKFLRWRHCHDVDCKEHPKHLGTMNLVSDGVHNFIDGVIIASSFLISIPLGIATTIAVAMHEIPQELGDFGVLVHSGFTPKKAVWYNFLFATLAILGTAITLLIGTRVGDVVNYMIPITAGGFVYIALSDLVPELHKEESAAHSLLQLLFILVGIGIMYLLLLIG
ncbi:MAG: Zinc transporter ZupT [bacterium ADurb.BinA186]|nr:MAG: Zinc transporter ZupT [bacterium ADurb.BinA186]